MTDTEILEHIKKLMEEVFGYDKKKICPQTDLTKLGLLSEDIDVFFVRYKEIFNVDMSEYDYYNYFYEDVLPFSYFKKVLKRMLTKDTKSLLVCDLIYFAKSEKWKKSKIN
ncbi:DUF1493 family protein [Christiangramia marina]|uniref:DUF1493 family protein n=1 Tax=Christiangramia marina TaxID=409436 RepID=UPI003AA93851